MSDLLSVQVDLYPQLLRRMAAGERLGSEADETEKLAASLLVAEAIEKDQAEASVEKTAEVKKEAIAELIAGGALGALIGPALKRGIQKLRGVPALPEGEAELVKSFRSIIDARSEADAAKRKLLLGIGGGALAGAAAIKALDSKKEKAAAAPVAEKKEAVAPSNIEVEKKSSEQSVVSQDARAVLGRLLKNFIE